MTAAKARSVQRSLRGLRRRSVGPAILYRPHSLSLAAGVPARVLEVAAPSDVGATSLSLRAPDGGRLRGSAPARLPVEFPEGPLIVYKRTATEATAEDGGLALSLDTPLSAAVAEGETVTLHPAAESVFPYAAPRILRHDRLPETLIGQVEAEFVLPALPGLPRPRPGDRLRVGDIESTVLALPSALGGVYVVQIGGAS